MVSLPVIIYSTHLWSALCYRGNSLTSNAVRKCLNKTKKCYFTWKYVISCILQQLTYVILFRKPHSFALFNSNEYN